MITHHSSLQNFTTQIKFVLNNYKNHGISSSQISNIVMGGLGGSGIGAQIVKSYFFDKCNVPIETVSDYNLPTYCNENSLVILNSYSGNTEESLNMYKEAKEKKSKLIIMASGGELKSLALSNGDIFYDIETGYQPRMTIGYGLSYLFLIVGEVCNLDMREDLEKVIEKFETQLDDQIHSANEIYHFFKPSFKNKFVIVTDKYFAPVAVRFCQQLQENSKLEGFVNILPEANHNVIESYYGKLPNNFVFLFSENNHRVSARFDFLTSLLEINNNKVLNMVIPVYSVVSIFDVIYRLDWVTLFLADDNGMDPMKIKNIMNLKEYLQQLEIIQSNDDETEFVDSED